MRIFIAAVEVDQYQIRFRRLEVYLLENFTPNLMPFGDDTQYIYICIMLRDDDAEAFFFLVS